ncbi:MAG: Uma2 family endonuclease [Pyrinomonadaceae bacterium]|nr:Uma2 family endonuclease [Pyrinomonadaceae bacterium]
MSTQRKARLTPEEYLAIERRAETKSEYLNGGVYAMVGASRKHNLITGNIFRQIGNQLRGKDCEAYINDMRVRVSETGLYTYPDVIVVCGEPQFVDAQVDTLLNPTLIVEVLSPSTESYDRGKKFAHYRTVGSLAEYALVAQDEPRVDLYTKQQDGRWVLSDAQGMLGKLELLSIGCTLDLTETYDKVEFDETNGTQQI